jgi:hypothetical protein
MKGSAAALLSIILLPAASPAANRIYVDDGSGRPGETRSIAVSAANDTAIQGFSVSIWFPPDRLQASGATYAGSVLEPLLPEYFEVTIDPLQGNIAFALILETSPPFDLVSLDPGPDTLRAIAYVTFTVLGSPTAPGAVPLTLADSPGRYPIGNIFADLGKSIVPALEHGSFAVLPRPFRRGFINADTRIDIADGIFLVSYIFLGGTQPTCLEASDTNGDRRLDIGDVVWLLSWYFLGGTPPPQPFGGCGDDPRGTGKLGCERQPICP